MSTPTCWRCGEPTGGALFCPACRTIQPPDPDYRRLLGLDRTLALDDADLQRRFYALSRTVHPDRFTLKSATERQHSTDATALLNDAYRTLRDPVARAEYALKQNGLDLGVQRAKDVPPELLEEVFELNMALEELRSGDSSARPPLEEARAKFLGLLAEVDRDLSTQFKAHDTGQETQALNAIRGLLNRRRYLSNLVREVEAALGAGSASAPKAD